MVDPPHAALRPPSEQLHPVPLDVQLHGDRAADEGEVVGAEHLEEPLLATDVAAHQDDHLLGRDGEEVGLS